MLRLAYQTEPVWLDLLGDVRVKVRPFTAGLMAAARANLDNGDLAEASAAERFVAFTSALASVAIIEWSGIEGEDGAPAPLSAEAVAVLMDIWLVNEAFQRLYVTPGLLMGAEKKS